MTDDLKRTIGAIESEGPSPEFVAALRARIAAEAGEELAPPEVLVVETPLLPDRDADKARVRRPVLAAAAAVLFFVVGALAWVATVASDDVALDSASGSVFVAGAPVLPGEEGIVDAGTYRVDTLGTPFTFTTDGPLTVLFDGPALMELGHPSSQAGVDRVLTFARLSALVDPRRPAEGLVEGAAGWPADDLLGWIGEVDDGVVLTDLETVKLGGAAALRVDLELAFGCPPSEICAALGTSGVDPIRLQEGAKYRLWLVDQGDEDPVMILAAFGRDTDAAWFDTVDELLSTLSFGPVAPHPISASTPGPTESAFFDGVRFDLPKRSYALRDPRTGDQVVPESWPARSAFVSNPVGVDGSPLPTPADVVTAIRVEGSEVTMVGSVSVDGIAAQVFDVDGSSDRPILRADTAGAAGWRAPARGRIWLIDHPDRGVLMLTAEASDLLVTAFPAAVENTEHIVETLEFVGD